MLRSGHVILSHGLESGPEATKVTAMAAAAEALGYTTERPDYRDFDADRDVGRIQARLDHLIERASRVQAPLVLAGSSMGAFISALASRRVACSGLFLLAPPIDISGFPLRLDASAVPIEIVHGWDDELIPAASVFAWAAPRRARLQLVDDSHRLAAHVEYCALEFSRFLTDLA